MIAEDPKDAPAAEPERPTVEAKASTDVSPVALVPEAQWMDAIQGSASPPSDIGYLSDSEDGD